jgi:hypothetical protein
MASDIAIGILPDVLRSAILTFETAEKASKAIPELARFGNQFLGELHTKKLAKGMTPDRVQKLAIEEAVKAKYYCGHCGRKIGKKHLAKGAGVPLTGQALAHGESVTVHLCSLKCQRQLSTRNERKLECLDKEMVALRNGEAVMNSMKAFLKKNREASQSQKQASAQATNSLS